MKTVVIASITLFVVSGNALAASGDDLGACLLRPPGKAKQCSDSNETRLDCARWAQEAGIAVADYDFFKGKTCAEVQGN